MDGSAEINDSDSGESWIILEDSLVFGDEDSEFNDESLKHESNVMRNAEKDEDTDGISIITDSDPETSSPCELNYLSEDDKDLLRNETIPGTIGIHTYVGNNLSQESRPDQDYFIGNNDCKLKTYVHKRNKRLSTVLNIILLGSIITAAGVAIGHMWGIRDDCTVHTTPSVNKILSNLYKLQEENAFLRSKLKELTFSNVQIQKYKLNSEKVQLKQNRCNKFYEGSINDKNFDKFARCIDSITNEYNLLLSDFDKEFLSDINKLKNIYKQNKSWLDDEVTRKLKNEKRSIKAMKEKLKTILIDNYKYKIDIENKDENHVQSNTQMPVNTKNENIIEDNVNTEKRITYTDSLKSILDRPKENILKINDTNMNIKIKKNKKSNQISVTYEDVFPKEPLSEMKNFKEDRYTTGHKTTQERKKSDWAKTQKKQKRKNKNEQWEMKGGCMKDNDDISETSLEHGFKIEKENKYMIRNSPTNNKISSDIFIDSKHKESDEDTKIISKSETQFKDWYDKRAALRMQARKKLEEELFKTIPNKAAWYFRRMRKREQCRTKLDNSTYQKLSKPDINYKTKY